MKHMSKLLAVLCALVLLTGVWTSALPAHAEEAKTVVDGVRWFPCEPGRENDELWEVECEQYFCLCQRFTDKAAETGYFNFLDTTYNADGSLTITRNGADGNEYYWPRIRTLMLESYPQLDWKAANTLYFDFTAQEGTQWNIALNLNGMMIKLSKVIADACGVMGVVNSDYDAPAGRYQGSINLQDALASIAAEGGTESSVYAKAIANMQMTFVPQITVFCVGYVGSSITINELFISTADDTTGANCDFADMGMIFGDDYYEIGNDPIIPDEPAEPAATVDGIRWFPCEPGKENDMAWEAECDMYYCGCQPFDADPSVTGFYNFLDTEYNTDGSLTVTRNGSDMETYYWPRIRTVTSENYPAMDIRVADTLYFDIDANAAWNLMLGMNGMTVKFSKVIAEACGVMGVVNSDYDAPAGHYQGSINLVDALSAIAEEGFATESGARAEAILSMKTTFVPQLQIFCIGDIGASLTVNELFIAPADDAAGESCTYFDMELLSPAADGVKGDLNGDDKVTIMDAVMLYYHVNGKTPLTDESGADMNGDGKVNISDAVTLYYFVNGKTNSL